MLNEYWLEFILAIWQFRDNHINEIRKCSQDIQVERIGNSFRKISELRLIIEKGDYTPLQKAI